MTLKNRELLRSAEERGFEVLLTTDTNLQYQQNFTASNSKFKNVTEHPCQRARRKSFVIPAKAGIQSFHELIRG